jgi:hypothetical protein
MLREDGHEIKTRAEDEQAAVIHWLLNLYLEHGDQWREIAQQETARIKAKVDSKVDAHNGSDNPVRGEKHGFK